MLYSLKYIRNEPETANFETNDQKDFLKTHVSINFKICLSYLWMRQILISIFQSQWVDFQGESNVL